MRIYKYEIDLHKIKIIDLPRGFRILTCQMQKDIIAVWAEVDPEAPAERIVFRTLITGAEYNVDGHRYINTVQYGELVLHIYWGNYIP